jgi:hypothetical protein
VSARHCECGYQARDADDLFIHLTEMLLPDEDTDRSGIAHAEVARAGSSGPLGCMCGMTTNNLAELDAHLLAVLMPADGIGANGARHAPAHGIFPEDFTGREGLYR